MDTEHNIRRFRQERYILTGLNHPNIARILDGGITDNSLPYLIMEYIDGIPIDLYCRNHQCTIRERIELLKSVCNAVQHAHNNLIIHRDLKPGNILVDARGHVKILDFGIAKLLEPDNLNEAYLRTQTGARILTMGYAAPEQINRQPITTGVDNYALGTLLYKLLSGVHPFEKEKKSGPEIESLITNVTPLKPSERFNKLPADQQKQLSRQLRTTPARVVKTLTGDLDAITLKNLRKEPDARYSSPNQLLEDLERFEKGLPVMAREDTIRYHSFKFLKRHKTSISTATVILLMVLGFGIFYTYQITQERNRAQLEADKAEQVTTFLLNLIEKNYPENARGDTVTVREVLESSIEEIQDLEKPTLVKAKIMGVIGHVYRSLGEYQKAKPLLKKTVGLYENTSSVPTTELANSYNILGIIIRDEGNYKLAGNYLRQSVQVYRELNARDSEDYAKALKNLAFIKRQEGKYDSALVYARESLVVEEKIYGKEDIQTAETLFILAGIYKSLGDYAKAETYQRQSLEICRKEIGEPHPGTAANLSNLGILLKRKNDLSGAKKIYYEALDMYFRLYGEKHSEIANTLGNLSKVYLELGRIDSAHYFAKRSLATSLETTGKDHLNTSYHMIGMAEVYQKEKNFDKADSLYQRALAIQKENLNDFHPDLSDTLSQIAKFHLAQARLDSARFYAQKAHDNLLKANIPKDYSLLDDVRNLMAKIQTAEATE